MTIVRWSPAQVLSCLAVPSICGDFVNNFILPVICTINILALPWARTEKIDRPEPEPFRQQARRMSHIGPNRIISDRNAL